MAAPGRLPRAARERQLLGAAERLFAEHGYDATSVEDVARAAGVTRPIVYDHFRDKATMFLACVAHVRRDLEEELTRALDGAPWPDAVAVIESGADAYFAMLERDPDRWLLMLTAVGSLDGELAALRLRTVRTVTGFADRLRLEPEAAVVAAHVLSGVAEQLGRWWLRHPDVPRARVVGWFRDVLVSGVGSLVTRTPSEVPR